VPVNAFVQLLGWKIAGNSLWSYARHTAHLLLFSADIYFSITTPSNFWVTSHWPLLLCGHAAFNPSWIEANSAGTVKAGLVVRTQNCTVGYPPHGCGLADPTGKKAHSCCACTLNLKSPSKARNGSLSPFLLAGVSVSFPAKLELGNCALFSSISPHVLNCTNDS
jgi:hypothetical protein